MTKDATLGVMDMTPFNISALISVPFFVAAAVLFVTHSRNRQAEEARPNGSGEATAFSNYSAFSIASFGTGMTIAYFGFGMSIAGAMV